MRTSCDTERTISIPDLAGRTGAEAFAALLRAEGVDTLFGFPGAAVLPILDVLRDEPLRFVLTRHEQGAAHMADGYARATGKVGVCLATSGPGATNLVTGLATAHMDSIPLVAFTGQVRTSLLGNDAFQEADTTGITRPVTKHNFIVTRAQDLGRIVRQAFHLARTGRPGPVLVDIDGDGSFAMTMAEVLTAVRYEQPVKFIVLNNGYLGMVRQWQELFCGRRYTAVENHGPDFAAVSAAFGARGIAVRERGEIEDALAAALRHEGPVVVDVQVEPGENVYPMVPAGKGLHEMELGTLA